jgi:hypothetical protein
MGAPDYHSFMPAALVRLILLALAVCRPLGARAESLPRKESNVSIRHEVQLAIDQGLAHLQSRQRAEGTWGNVGTTGFVLMAFQRDPRERGRSFSTGADFGATLEKGYAGLRQAFPENGDWKKMDGFAWHVPPAVLALSQSRDPRDMQMVARARQAIAAAPLPETLEARALFLALDPKHRSLGRMPSPPTGSGLCAWLWMLIHHDTGADSHAARDRAKSTTAVIEWLSGHYTLERNPEGEGVHQYYFWLSSVLGSRQDGWVAPELQLAGDGSVDIPHQLAEKLINAQKGDGSWSGIGDHWTENDPDLVTALCVLALEQAYRQL